MEQYIKKSDLVAEIERLKERFIAFHHRDGNDWPLDNYGKMRAYNEVLSFLDTLEVKEVDLKEYYHEFLQKEWFGNSHVRTVSEMMAFTAKHFFELGLKAQKGEEV